MNNDLKQNLRRLDFDTDSSFSGLCFANQAYQADEIGFGELLVLEHAKRLDATAVYFRRNPDSSTTLPQIFIYDNTMGRLTGERLVDIHRKLWTSDIVSAYYVIETTQVKIFDTRKPIEHENDELSVKPFETVSLASEAQAEYQKYSAKLFDNGTFWEQDETRNSFLYDKSASKRLLEGLKKFRDAFVKQFPQRRDAQALAHKILVQSILVKYLEERRDIQDNRVFEDDFFVQFAGAQNFCEVIHQGQLVNLFDVLSIHFNGKIFELTSAEKAELAQVNLSTLADFLDAKKDGQQYVIWRLYAFEYLPIELISRIYEEFLPQRTDAVYTPVHLAQLMVDECMPLNEPKNDYKLIDVSCGSGIFLVIAFKRLVQWWQKQRYEQIGQLEAPDIATLQKLLRTSIYGVDIESEAIRLAVFSLSIALCDLLEPTEIWTKLKFDDLEVQNLYTGDFFEYLSQARRHDFDLVIGNPPFEDQSKVVPLAIETYNLKPSCAIPRHQLALLFLQQAMKLLKSGGLLCLVMPAGPLLYNDTLAYRRDFFERYEVAQIVDLSALKQKGHLFERDVSTVVLFTLNHPPPENHIILHVAVKRSNSTKARRYFEIEHYDLHFVPQDIAISEEAIWKINLWGGGQLHYLRRYLLNERTFEDYLSLPFPEDESVLKLSRNEQIIVDDILDYGLEAYKRGETAKVNTDLVTTEQLQVFGEIFCSNLNSVYQVDDKCFYPLKPLETSAYIGYPFMYGTPCQQSTTFGTNDLEQLMENEGHGVKYRRVLKLYSSNMVTLIKPKTLRYWLRSIALRDATDILQDLVEQGY